MFALDEAEKAEWQMAQYVEWQRAALVPLCLHNWLKTKRQTLGFNDFIPEFYWLPGMKEQTMTRKPWQEIKADLQEWMKQYNDRR